MLRCGYASGGRLMRLDFGNLGPVALALCLLAGCSGNDVTDFSAELGCGQVDGLVLLTGEKPPAYIIVGETIETKEAPAASAELACQLAARQPKESPLWVGLPDYIGGTTDAVQAMRRRLSDLIAMGAPRGVGNSMKGSITGASTTVAGHPIS